MAERRSTRTVAAREKARARTAAAREREQRLEDLATTWFEVDDEMDALRSAAQQRIDQYIARVNGDLANQIGELQKKLQCTGGEMLGLTNVSSVADRLGVPVAKVREIKASLEAGEASTTATPVLTEQTAAPAPETDVVPS